MSRCMADSILKMRKANLRYWLLLSTNCARTSSDSTRYYRLFRMNISTSLKLIIIVLESEGCTRANPPDTSKLYLINYTGVILSRYFTVSIRFRSSFVPSEMLTSEENFKVDPSIRFISF